MNQIFINRFDRVSHEDDIRIDGISEIDDQHRKIRFRIARRFFECGGKSFLQRRKEAFEKYHQ